MIATERKPRFSRKAATALQIAIHDADRTLGHDLVDVALCAARMRAQGREEHAKSHVADCVRASRRDWVWRTADEFIEAAGNGPIERERR